MDTKFWKKQFKTLRLSKGLTQSQMADKLGVSQSLINLLESGKRNFTQSLLDRIIEKLDITLYEFMFEGNDAAIPLMAEVHESIGSDQSVPLIEWEGIASVAQNGVDTSRTYKMVHTPKAASNNAFALTVKDDAMQPRFMQGDRIVIDPEKEPQNFDTALVRLNDKYELKVYSQNADGVKLDVYNKKYPYTRVPQGSNIDFEVIGKVIGLIAKF